MLANWTYSGVDALDGETSNDTAATPFPLGTYSTAVAPVVDLDVAGIAELTIARARRGPLGDEGAVAVELLDPVVADVGHIDAPVGAHGELRGMIELAFALDIGLTPELREQETDRYGDPASLFGGVISDYLHSLRKTSYGRLDAPPLEVSAFHGEP